jgi:2'-5' RNA ligase
MTAPPAARRTAAPVAPPVVPPVASPVAPRRRLFLALWPGPATLRALLAWRTQWRWPPGAAVVPSERLHLTLHFIGMVDAARVPELAHGLQVAWRRFEIVFDRAEAWPRGLVVLGASATPPALAELHGRLADALRCLELPVEARAFRPHVTLARKATHAGHPATAPALRWPVHGYALVDSERGYRTLARYPAPPASQA